MPLIIATGNLFDQEADVYVSTVNCVGVMGAGVAKSVTERWPHIEKEFRQLCGRGLNCEGTPDQKYQGRKFDPLPPCLCHGTERECAVHRVRPGHLLFSKTKETSPKWVLHFPTKRHWNGPSSIEDIETSLTSLQTRLRAAEKPLSIALPAPGCANGGLRWRDVLPLVELYLGSPDIKRHKIISLEPMRN